jgi:nicotinate-nucleotide pyrophosphorylase (carboxylating)
MARANNPKHDARRAGPAEDKALLADAERLVAMALAEDVGPGDLTGRVCLPAGRQGSAEIVARDSGILAGLWIADLVYLPLGGGVTVSARVGEGEPFEAGRVLAAVAGPVDRILTGERTVLNFLQRLSAVATLTRRYVDAVFGTVAAVCDTRKTTPGWRRLEKYAVRLGGGTNHRMGLYDEMLIKDNHLALAGKDIVEVVREARAEVGPDVVIEVEVDTLDQFRAVLSLPADMILLDNMSPELMRQAVSMRDAASSSGRPLLEASGGITLANVRAVAESGVDRISIGALTHSAGALDIAMDVHTT